MEVCIYICIYINIYIYKYWKICPSPGGRRILLTEFWGKYGMEKREVQLRKKNEKMEMEVKQAKYMKIKAQ
jgi:hypothetical protein